MKHTHKQKLGKRHVDCSNDQQVGNTIQRIILRQQQQQPNNLFKPLQLRLAVLFNS